jgi:CubicO group peptidase (beta-lactamase class C family)
MNIRFGGTGATSLILAICMSSATLSGPARAETGNVLDELEAYAVGIMQEQKVLGMAYAIVKDDEVIYSKGFGVRDQATGAPVDTHTVFEIGSTSKAFTTTLLAMLDDEDRIDWTDPVLEHLPEFAMMDPWVTREFQIVDLVSQRSGMTPYSLDLMAFLGFNREDIVRAVRFVEPITSFRSTFGYVNTLFLAAAHIVEDKTGLSWEDNLDVSIFGPLGMTETTANPEVVATLTNIARGHLGTASGEPWPIPDDWTYGDWIDTYGPAGGIRSNVLDMTKWIRMHLGRGTFEGNQLVSAENIAAMYEPKVFASNQSFGEIASYASAWIYNSFSPYPVVWHNGSTSGMHSIVALVPKANVGLVVLTNTVQNTVPERILAKAYALYFHPENETSLLLENLVSTSTDAAMTGPGLFFPRPARDETQAAISPQLSLPLERYTGTYANPAYGQVIVSIVDNALHVVMGPKQLDVPLVSFSGNTFTGLMPDMPVAPDSEILVTFVVPTGGNAREMVINAFADVNGGRFTRTSECPPARFGWRKPEWKRWSRCR